MASDVQLPEPAETLLRVATDVTPGWLRRVARSAAGATVATSAEFGAELDALVESDGAALVAALAELLATDVDGQRTNPLSLYRDAVGGVTELLRRHAVPPPAPDPFASEHFPDDVYRLGPAAWSDVDPALHEPGLVWGAWKAMTVLRRRRAEGQR